MSIRIVIIGALFIVLVLLLLSASTTSAQFCKGDFDYDADIDAGDVTIFLEHFGREQYYRPCPPDGPAPVPITGQSTTYYGEDDGFWKKGVEYPISRFDPDIPLALVRDRLTSLNWMSTPSENHTWQEAIDFCATKVPAGTYRLPNIKEMMSLFDYGYNTPALCNTSGYQHHVQDNPFTLPESQYYWTSTTYDPDDSRAWYYNVNYGTLGNQDKAIQMNAWCVTDGHPIYPRFTDNGDHTVTDNNTGLVWLWNATCGDINDGMTGLNWNDAMLAVEGLGDGICGLTDDSSPGEWRLPTFDEWEEFKCFYESPAVCDSRGTGQHADGPAFTNVMLTKYWSSTVDESNPTTRAWASDIGYYGNANNFMMTEIFNVWPVRRPH